MWSHSDCVLNLNQITALSVLLLAVHYNHELEVTYISHCNAGQFSCIMPKSGVSPEVLLFEELFLIQQKIWLHHENTWQIIMFDLVEVIQCGQVMSSKITTASVHINRCDNKWFPPFFFFYVYEIIYCVYSSVICPDFSLFLLCFFVS